MADLSATVWNRFPARARALDQVSKHFRFHELTRSPIAQRQRIDNSFAGANEIRAAVHLCRKVLEPLREAFGPFTPNSVYRCQGLERALKNMPDTWTSTSQHTLGEACDVEISSMTTLALAEWAAKNLEFDQIICECYDPARGPSSGWVHISLRRPDTLPNRRQLLSYVWNPRQKKYSYSGGLNPSLLT